MEIFVLEHSETLVLEPSELLSSDVGLTLRCRQTQSGSGSSDSNVTTSGPFDVGKRPQYFGMPRGSMPFFYRLTLAQGVNYMQDTLQLYCPMNESGRALENGTGLFLARITHADGEAITPGEIESASYTVYRLENNDAGTRTPVEGHSDVLLPVDEILLPLPRVDENWVFDSLGYNFHHAPDDAQRSPFPKAGRNYLVCYQLRPKQDRPKILIQYRVRVV